MSGASAAPSAAIEYSTDQERIDWEKVFEDQDQGIIALISQASTFKSLKKCMIATIDTLFSRDGDLKSRESYYEKLSYIFPIELGAISTSDAELDKAKAASTDVLRGIKNHRITMEEQARSSIAAPGDGRPRRSTDGDTADDDSQDEIAEEIFDVEQSDTANTEAVFVETICSEFRSRFNMLQEGIQQTAMEKIKLPYLLSEKFSEYLEQILREYFIPDLKNRCSDTIQRGRFRAVDTQQHYFQVHAGSSEFGDLWKAVWDEVITPKKAPAARQQNPRLQRKKKKNLFDLLRIKTVLQKETEETEVSITDTQEANEPAINVWELICAPSENYHAPIPELDAELLMNFIALPANTLADQIHAIDQIVEQSEEIGRAFDVFQRDKNVEIPLLSITYRNRNIFLGKRALLKEMLMGFRAHEYPLISRYLPNAIRK
ncbi:MAG: hypothetical protein HQ503_06255 [Rhodospirillales bacterium]|nr:hypothetical protein [Rhodospirillales bacterium]